MRVIGGSARARRAAFCAVVITATLATTGCQGGAQGSAGADTPTPAPPATVTLTASDAPEQPSASTAPTATATASAKADGAPTPLTAETRVEPDDRLSAEATGGELVSVRVTDRKGRVVPGEIVDGVWRTPSTARLVPATTYTWKATAKNADGALNESTGTFRTITPKVTATYTVTPDGSTVGVGMPVMVTFDSPVQTRAMRADVERRLTITTTPAQKGSWGWVDDRQLMWRPETYWKAGTKVVVKAPLTGVRTGKDKWVGQDKGATFSISPRGRVSRVDIARHVMTVSENGKRVATYPISAGRATPAWETRSGTKVITEKHATYVMDAGTLGVGEDDPHYYKTEVKHALRVTNTGEFLHGAPWSVSAQGRRNVSHGCVNLGPRDAAEMYRESMIGDVVEFVGSGRRMKPGDGLSVWLYSPQEWRKLSAL